MRNASRFLVSEFGYNGVHPKKKTEFHAGLITGTYKNERNSTAIHATDHF